MTAARLDRRANRGGRPGHALRRRTAHQLELAGLHSRNRALFTDRVLRPSTAIRQGDSMPSASAAVQTDDTTSDIDLRERLRAISEDDQSYPQSRMAKEAGISATALSQWLSGTYPGDNGKVAAKIATWLRSYDERLATGGLPEGPAWVATPSAEKVLAGLRYAQLANDVVVIYGGAGLGKSKAIERYRQTSPNVFAVELTPAHSGVLGCLEEIAIQIGLRDYTRQAAFLHRVICARVRNTRGILVIDEAQHMGVQALDQVRAIHDATHIGLALVGNERVYTQMAGSNRAAYLDRLYSRIGKRIHLKRASDKDADALIKAWGIDDAKCRQRIRDIAAKPGALRVLTKTLRLAATYAQAAKRRVCCDDIQASWRELGGLD